MDLVRSICISLFNCYSCLHLLMMVILVIYYPIRTRIGFIGFGSDCALDVFIVFVD